MPLDNFTRADETPLNPANWGGDVQGRTLHRLAVVSNKCVDADAAAGNTASGYWLSSFGANQFAEMQVGSTADFYQVECRLNNVGASRNSYAGICQPGPGHVTISSIAAGVETSILDTGVTWAVNDVIRLTCIGNVISIFRNGALIGTVTSTVNTGGGFIALGIGKGTSVVGSTNVLYFDGGVTSAAAKAYYMASGGDGTTNFGAMIDGAPQTAATRVDGWTVAKTAAANFSLFTQGGKAPAGSFGTTVRPATTDFPNTSNGDAFKTPTPLSGTFDIGSWVFTFAVRAGTASAQAGRIRMRVWKSIVANPSTTGQCTELTTAVQTGTTSAVLSTTADVTSAVTWAPGTTITLNNEYLFFVIAWEITTASGSNNGDVLFRTGSAFTTGSQLVTPNFTGPTQISGSDNNGTTTESASVAVLASPAGSVIDSFTRANQSPLASGWLGSTVSGGLQVLSNVLTNPGAAQDQSYYNTPSPVADMDLWIEISGTVAAAWVIDLWARMTTTDFQNGYYIQFFGTSSGAGQLTLNKSVAGIASQIGGSGVALSGLSSGDAVGITVRGNQIVAWARIGGTWISEVVVHDSAITAAGYPGIQMPNGPATFDNFSGNVTPVVSSTPISGTDVNGTVTESGTLSPISVAASDSDGVITEAASIVAKLTVTDPDPGTYAALPSRFATYSVIPGQVATYKQLAGSSLLNYTEIASAAIPPTPISGTDSNGTTTETATPTAKTTVTDVNTATVEAATPQVSSFTATDANSATTETPTVKVVITATDVNGTVTENGSVVSVNQVSSTDANGVTTESATPQVSSFIATDINAATTETPTVKALVSAVDANGTVTDSGTIATGTPISASDSNGPTYEFATTLPVGLTVQLDASQLALADGASLSSWPNLVTPVIPGNVVHSPSPVFHANAQNGKGVVKFSALQGVIQVTGMGISSPFTLLYVAHMTSTGANAQRIGAAVFNSSAGSENIVFGWWNGNQDALFDGAWGGSGPPFTPVNTNWKLYSFDKNGSSPIRMFSDGTFLMNGGSGAMDLRDGFQLSGYEAPTAEERSDCEVAEVLIFNRLLSDTERQQAESYLRNKWFATTVSGSDSNGTTTESASITSINLVTATDVDGVITETATGQVTNLVATDTNATTTESATNATFNQVNGTDANGTTTESATFVSNVTVTDTNGATTENTVLTTVYQISGSDANGSVTETTTSVAKLGDVDANGGTTEAASNAAFNQISANDVNGVVTEAQATIAKLTGTDTNAAVVENTAQAISAVVDSNSLVTEATGQTAQLPVTDVNGSTNESGSTNTSNQISASDANSVTNESGSISLTTASTGAGDTGTASETSTTVVQLTGVDNNSTVSESASLSSLNQFTVTDAGSDTEANVLQAKFGDVDVNGGVVETTGNRVLSSADVNGPVNEVGDVGTIKVGLDSNGVTNETASFAYSLVASDTNGATNEAVVYKLATVVDSSGTTSVEFVRARLVGTDGGTITETQIQHVKGVIHAKPGRIVYRTRGETTKLTTGRTMHTTRGDIAKVTTGRVVNR